MKRLTEPFFLRSADVVARELLGKYLLVEHGGERVVVRLTETEAYLGREDRACHSYGGRRTARTEAMYLPGGHAYVYFIYGSHFCLNVVTGPVDDPCAVLLRGAEVVAGRDTVGLRRFGRSWEGLSPAQKRSLTDGPGKLCQALGVGREHNGRTLLEWNFCLLEEVGEAPPAYEVTPRIGLGKSAGEAADALLRYVVRAGNT